MGAILSRLREQICSPVQAFFLDIPNLIDSAWHHVEYALSAECAYTPGPNPTITTRSIWGKPHFWFFAVTVFFVSYGPTWDALCAIAPQPVTSFLRQALGVIVVLASLVVGAFLASKTAALIRRRYERVARDQQQAPVVQAPPCRRDITACRRVLTKAVIYFGLLILIGAGVWAGAYLYMPSDDLCGVRDGNVIAFARFAMCIAAIIAFGCIASSPRASVKRTLVAQGAILALVALIQWFGLVPLIERLELTAAPVREASDLPYRHIFEAWAPCIVAVLALAPCIARCIFRRVPDDERERFRRLLAGEELFVRPQDPELSGRRIGYALIYGPAYHPLHLLLFPSLVALVVAAKWLYLAVVLAGFFSFLLLVWGNVSSRWQQLNIYIERWFLRGTPLLVSLVVIVVAILRVAQFDYVSTILDAAPFGFVFGLVLMNYVLFWLVEYWTSRAAAAQLLRVLAPDTAIADEVRIAYAPSFHAPDVPAYEEVEVHRDGRYLMSHSTGRFVAVGTVGKLDPQPQAAASAGNPVTAFHGYYLMELFSRLGERTGPERERNQNHEFVLDIVRRTAVYFFWMNFLLFVVTAAFVICFLRQNLPFNAIDPVITVRAAPSPPEQLVDLASLLTQNAQKPENPVRPAIVVVGSGGGTRAALYTASVLNGLHRLGVDGDIVLVSGVSGGGAALAYYAANRDALTAQAPSAAPGPCPGDAWTCFTKDVTEPFIEDVLNGGTEWRLFGTTPLSTLLAESFARRLPSLQSRFGSIKQPALILNATMISHPDAESQVLERTIDKSPTCDEAERTYKPMGGGRLIFTNVRDVKAFPNREDKLENPIPDVRLPYRIVQDADAALAIPAAVNANFPPVFPSVRIRFDGKGPNGCQYLSYYASDGGAEENLGLISALYALESALAKVSEGAARPIHVVIAEASAVTYDYSQDRGLSAALGGSTERLTGGLTNELIDRVRQKLHDPSGEKKSIQFHYLDLPLAFRARGGFGTHWMYAKEYHLNDPRPRAIPFYNSLPLAWLRPGKATVDRNDLEALWRALHDPRTPFCKADLSQEKSDARKVQEWICGSSTPDSMGRDVHMEEWQKLVTAMQPYQTP